MQRWEQHAIQEWHVFHTRVKHGNVQISKMDPKKPLPSQRRVAWQCIYTRWRTPNGQHINKNKNAMVTVHPTYIEKWWCMRRRVEIWKCMFHHPQGHLQKKKGTKLLPIAEGFILCRTTICSHRQKRFDGHMNPQSPHHRGLSQTTNKCSFPKHARPPISAQRWHTQSGSYPQASWTVLWLPPILRSQIRIAPRT